MIIDPQNVITKSPGKPFLVGDIPIAFYYHRRQNGHLKQCSVFGYYQLKDGSEYMIVSYTRPHVLDKSKVSKVAGRTIAAARLAKFIKVVREANVAKAYEMKGIRIYSKSGRPRVYTYPANDGGVTTFSDSEWDLEQFNKTLQKKDGGVSAARCEKISQLLLARMYRKLTNK